MKNITLNYHRTIAFAYILLSVVFSACQDTRSFENVRKLKTGMTIVEVEKLMGEPLIYDRESDSSESRTYVYDNSGNGMDRNIRITFVNEKSVIIRNY